MSTLRAMNEHREHRPAMTKEIAQELVAALEAGEHRDRVAKAYYGDDWRSLRTKLIYLGYCGEYLTKLTEHCKIKRSTLLDAKPQAIGYLSDGHVPDKWLDFIKKHHKSYQVGVRQDEN